MKAARAAPELSPVSTRPLRSQWVFSAIPEEKEKRRFAECARADARDSR